MRILFFIPYPISPPWFNLDLELIQTHLDQGDDVRLLGCNGNLAACDFNATHNPAICLQCIGRRRHGVSLLSRRPPVQSFLRLTPEQRRRLAQVPTRFATLKELKRFHIENFDIGWAVVASVIWLTRDPDPDLEVHGPLIRDLILSAAAVYLSMQNHLDTESVDRVYLFTGKHAVLRAALRACQSRGIDCYIEERGHDCHHYELFKNTLPHDLKYNVSEIRRYWDEAADNPRRDEIAAQFYEERAQGVSQAWYSYVTEQRRGLLPAHWDPGKKNIAIFNTSQDEFGGIGDEYVGPLYESQLEGLTRILQSLASNHVGMNLYLRIHPNLKGVHNRHEDQVRNLRAEFLTVIQPEDPVSSYTLLNKADRVLTFGSTVGIEAVYWGIPSILAGQICYRDLGGTYNPSSHEELIDMLHRPLVPRDKTAALMYGYYCKTFGTPCKYFVPEDPYDGKFKGVFVRPERWLGRLSRALSLIGPVQQLAGRLSRSFARKRLVGRWTVQ